MADLRKLKIVFVVVYFGTLPNYFQLWLNSCRRNDLFTWLLITDCKIKNFIFPDNVIIKSSDLLSIKNFLSRKLGINVGLDNNYKLCDLKPTYWMLLDKYNIEYGYWGHCDIDLIFGRLDLFLTPDLLSRYDRVFGLGHLSLMRASPLAKLAFTFRSSAPSWIDILCKSENFGFDEHSGVNRTWDELPLLFYEDESIAADIDPQFEVFRLTDLSKNNVLQIFYIDNGKVLQGFFDRSGKWLTREYAYIHIQKRSMPIGKGVFDAPNIMLSSSGFSFLPNLPRDAAALRDLPGVVIPFTFKTWLLKVKTRLRYLKK